MNTSKSKFFSNLLAILLVVTAGYYFKDDIKFSYKYIFNQIAPCQSPITYSIGTIDPRFNLSKADLLKDISTAKKIWEDPVSKQLFEYSPTGELKVNLVYDYRQKATESISKIGLVINDDKSSYESLKAKYDSLNNAYTTNKSKLDSLTATYNTEKSAYEKDVAYWNSHGGASKGEYAILEQKRIDLNNQVASLNQLKDTVNASVDTLNSVRVILNKLIAELNLQVDSYNTAGSSINSTFREGEYVSSATGTEINIYQYDSGDQLVRVLAHELGHAIGLDHINNPKAIMYYINEGSNEKLTMDDLNALKKRCMIK